MCEVLEARGFTATPRTDPNSVVEDIGQGSFDALLIDLHMQPIDGLTVCRRIHQAHPNLPVVLVTGDVTVESTIGALRAGAFDFVPKPVDVDLLELTVERAVEHHRMRTELHRLRDEVATVQRFDGLLGSSAGMRRVTDTILQVAPSEATVLISGESGTGKELVARAIHEASGRRDGPFVAINCAAVPATLLESELFGHAKGAFTDAKTSHKGLFLEAEGGTLFLDEIGEMPLEMQVKLLRALQERSVRPVGGANDVSFDARLLAATNVDLENEVAEGRFREDLFYRIHVCTVEMPPLREREGDVILLSRVFVERLARRQDKAIRGIAEPALEKLAAYRWPGNVRELENSIERAVAMARFDQIVVEDLPDRVRNYRASLTSALLPQAPADLVTTEELERRYVLHVLSLVSGNKSRAARILGYDRRTLYRKLARYADNEAASPEALS
jgi:two-component system response regulator HydG